MSRIPELVMEFEIDGVGARMKALQELGVRVGGTPKPTQGNNYIASAAHNRDDRGYVWELSPKWTTPLKSRCLI